jgi:replication-associated recombination protein RarA
VEFYKKDRPKQFEQVHGQPKAVAALKGFFDRGEVPHAMLFTGPSGCGKTTLVRILARMVGCSKIDFSEYNSARVRGIDTAREIISRVNAAPIGGTSRVWYLDEVHQMTKDAQNALLKVLEDTPAHAYFMLATTEPDKLIKAIHTRCTTIELVEMSFDALAKTVKTVAELEGIELSEAVLEKLCEIAEGSARKALVLLNELAGIADETNQLAQLNAKESKAFGIELARKLFNAAPWPEVAKQLKGLVKENDDGTKTKEDPEGVRRLVLGYCAAVLKNGMTGPKAARAFWVMDCFKRPFYDNGEADLVYACYEVCNARKDK